MSKYIFILGHSPALSILEITKVLPLFSKKFTIEIMSREVLIINSVNKISEQKILETLGGAVKVSRILKEIEDLKDSEELLKNLEGIIKEKVKRGRLREQKVKFGFSLYFGRENFSQKKFWRKKFNQLGIKLKRHLRNNSLNSRFLVSRDFDLTSVIIQKEKLINQGFDFIIFVNPERNYLALTVACQDFKSYISRDYGRPQKDLHRGMLPVKLAKMMINISQAEKGEIVLDPFCGSGTILQEALILGYKLLIGTDEDQQAIINSQNNLNWLIKKLNLNAKNYYIQLHHVAVQNLNKKIPLKKVGTIISEPYLGSPLKSQANFLTRREEIKKIENLYHTAFQNFFSVLKKNGRVIIIWPVYKVRSGEKEELIFIPERLLTKIKLLGFKQEDLTAIFQKLPEFTSFLTKRGTILYFRSNQRVQREVLVFQKR